MALSLLHQTVLHAGPTFTPDLTVNGWFTVHWYNDADLHINPPTALLGLNNGQEFLMDILVHDVGDPEAPEPKVISWDDLFYRPADYTGTADLGLLGRGLYWDGNLKIIGSPPGRGIRIMVLMGTGRLLSQSMIQAY